MGVIGAIGKGFSVATKSLGLVLILFVFNVLGSVASLPFANVAPGAAATPQLTAGALIFSIAFILISIFIQGGTLGLVRDAVKDGKMNLAAMPQYGLKYYLRLLGLGALIVLIIAIIALIAGLLIAVTAPINNPIVTTIAIVLAIVLAIGIGLMFFIPFTLSPYAIICDDMGIVDAMKKGIEAGRNPFSRVFVLLGLIALLVLIALAVGFVIGFLVGLVTAFLPAAIGRGVMMVVTSALNGYLGVMITASFTVYYLGITKKTEGVAAKKVF
jgi:hypothetical protein